MNERAILGPAGHQGHRGDCDYYERHAIRREEQMEEQMEVGGEGDRAATEAASDPLATHLRTCATCRLRQGQITRLRRALSALPAPVSDAGWEQVVWRRVAEGRRRPPGRLRGWVTLAVPLAAAGLAGLLLVRRTPAPPPVVPPEAPVLAFAKRIDKTARFAVRGPAGEAGDNETAQTSASVGDVLMLEARGLSDRAAAVWIYSESGGLTLACSTEPPCRRDGPRLRAELRLGQVGQLRAVLVTGPAPLPRPTGSLDEDLATLRRQGLDWRDLRQDVD